MNTPKPMTAMARVSIIVMALGLPALIVGCNEDATVTITYGPLANYAQKSATAQTLFMANCIYSIRNLGKDAQDFTFDILFLKPGSGTTLVKSTLQANPQVKKGQEAKDLGIITFTTDATGESEEDMTPRWATFTYSNPQKPKESVLVVQFPQKPKPLWAGTTVAAPNQPSAPSQPTLPKCQGPQ